jgi:hypothetical protein
MSNFLSHYTTYLANRLCGGSSRKLIAGWWYGATTTFEYRVVSRRVAREAALAASCCSKV